MKHQDTQLDNIHIPYNWTYADATARMAGSYTAGDAGKLARQLDDNSLWMLSSATGGWVRIGGGNAAGVTTIGKAGYPLFGDVILGVGYGTTIDQSGQMITITVSGSTVSLYNDSPADVSSATASGSSSLASRGDHVHRGLHSLQATGSSPIYGDAFLVAGSNITFNQSGQVIKINASGGGGGTGTAYDGTPQDVAATGASGTTDLFSRGDHVHKGIHSIQKTGSAAMYGDVFLTEGSNLTITQSGQNILFSAASGGTMYNGTPADVAATGASGTSSAAARGDHIHKGVHSLRATGSAQLFGDVELVGLSGTYVSQSGQVIGIWRPVVQQALFASAGDVVVGSGVIRIYNNFGMTKTISKVMLSANTAPTGADLIVDINKGGTTIFTTQSNRPKILAGANTGNSTTIEVNSWADGEYLTADVDQIGSTIAGANLSIHIVFS